MNANPSRLIRLLATVLLTAGPVLAFGWLWAHYAVDVPKWDDHALREFLTNLSKEPTLSGKVYYLFRQHNEHRIVYDRIVAYLADKLTGRLNYVHLMAVGNLSLVGLLMLFGAVLRRAGQSLWYAAPVAFLLFNLSQWENLYWGMAALQNFSVVLFVLWAIYRLTYADDLSGALALATLATLTSGNGILVWPVGFALLAYQRFGQTAQTGTYRRSSNPLWWWSLTAVVVVGLYFVGYEKPAGNPPLRGSVTDLLRGWLAFLGAAAEVLPVGLPFTNCVALGGLLVGFVVVYGLRLLRNRPAAASNALALTPFSTPQRTAAGAQPMRRALRPVDAFFVGSAAFVLGTGAVVAWSRVGFGADLLITSRYKIYSLTLLAVVYTYSVVRLGSYPRLRRTLGVGGVLGGLALAWLSYVAFVDDALWWRHWLLTNQFNWYRSEMRPARPVSAQTPANDAAEVDFYVPLLTVMHGPAKAPLRPLTMQQTLTTVTVTEATLPPADLGDRCPYVVARSDQRAYLFPTWPNVRSGRLAQLWPSRRFGPGFWAFFDKRDLIPGTYRLFVLAPGGDTPRVDSPGSAGGWTLYPTNQVIHLTGQPLGAPPKNW